MDWRIGQGRLHEEGFFFVGRRRSVHDTPVGGSSLVLSALFFPRILTVVFLFSLLPFFFPCSPSPG